MPDSTAALAAPVSAEPASSGSTPALPSRADVAAVADTFVTLMRSFTRARTRLLAAAAHDVEWSAHIVMRCVAAEGPMRSSALAECIQSDPSTVSRQVAALVKDGFLERRADPVDGRASLLITTPKAERVLADHDEIRLQHFGEMLSDWSDRDLRRFAELLRRFTADFDTANAQMLDKVAARSDAAEGRNA